MTDTPIDWPLAFKPEQASFYIQTLTARFSNPFTNHVQVLERDGARWLARMALRFADDKARAFDAFLAGLRGVVEVMVPDFRRLSAAGSLAGAPQLASGSGTTLTAQVDVAERPGARWRAELTIQALPEQARRLDALLASGSTTLLPLFGKQSGHGVGPSLTAYATEIGSSGFNDGTLYTDGFGFTEGAGTVSVIGGCLSRLALGGCRPGSVPLIVGDLIQTSPGRAHLITSALPADNNGVALCTLAPPLRAPPMLGIPITAGCRVAMMLVGGDAADGSAEPPTRTTYRLAFEEDLSWPIA